MVGYFPAGAAKFGIMIWPKHCPLYDYHGEEPSIRGRQLSQRGVDAEPGKWGRHNVRHFYGHEHRSTGASNAAHEPPDPLAIRIRGKLVLSLVFHQLQRCFCFLHGELHGR